MAKFLTTKQLASQLEELITDADKILYLVSPYLKLSNDFKEQIFSRDKREKKTIIIYGKSDLTPEHLKFLTGLRYVHLKFHENLHAKCYINDTKLIITSLNFYEFSMINNKEIGVVYDLNDPNDQDIYNKAFDHVRFIEENSNDKPFEPSQVLKPQPKTEGHTNYKHTVNRTASSSVEKKNNKPSGFCIRTGVQIPFNVEKPLSYEAFKSWSKFNDPNHPEKFCHFTGESSNGETSVGKPIMRKNWKKAKDVFDFA